MNVSKSDKGVAGLNVLLGVVVLLFIIGFLVMIFAILGAETEEAIWTDSSGTVANETISGMSNLTFAELSKGSDNNPVCTLLYAWNATSLEEWAVANWTSTPDCKLKFVGTVNDGAIGLNNSGTQDINFTYTFSSKLNNTASLVIFDSSDELSGTTDWFSIIIVLSAMVVLILLTVMIITSIRGSGFGVGGGSGKVAKTSA